MVDRKGDILSLMAQRRETKSGIEVFLTFLYNQSSAAESITTTVWRRTGSYGSAGSEASALIGPGPAQENNCIEDSRLLI